MMGADDQSCPVGSGSWQDKGRGAERYIPVSLSPPVRDRGPAGCPSLPSPPRPFCAPNPKALSSLLSNLHGDPGAFPVSPAAVGPFRGNSHGLLKGPATARDTGRALVPFSPLGSTPIPLLFPPALSTKETFLVLSLHNKLRSKVQPPAANMQKLVSPLAGPVFPTFDVTSTFHPVASGVDSPWVIHSSWLTR